MATTCSKSCGGGKQLQTRTIANYEENGGALCTGENIQESDCNIQSCLVGNPLLIYLDELKKNFFCHVLLVSYVKIHKIYLLLNIKLIVSGVAGAMLQLAAKVVEEENNFKQELSSRMRKMAELSVMEKICKKSIVMLKSVLKVMVSVAWFYFS